MVLQIKKQRHQVHVFRLPACPATGCRLLGGVVSRREAADGDLAGFRIHIALRRPPRDRHLQVPDRQSSRPFQHAHPAHSRVSIPG